MKPILECIPNFSEGADESVLTKIAEAIRSVPGVFLLHTDKSPAANRTVFTFAGDPDAVTEAAFRGISVAAACIDMRNQKGVHPRIGATDVCPLVPLQGMSEADANVYALQLAERVGKELSIPVFLYEYSQSRTYRAALPVIRKGQYEGLSERMTDAAWHPDFGPVKGNPVTGATVIGVRRILVAFNISLNTKDVLVAESIARTLRQSGYWQEGDGGQRRKVQGLLPMVRAIGWYMEDYGQAQVSFNLLDYHTSSLLTVWLACRQAAAAIGVSLAGSELIGLVPEACMLEAGRYAAGTEVSDPDTLINAAINMMGLAQLKPFVPEEKILERAWHRYSGTVLKLN
ncbi:MAG: glutamate formimidoyltransferase [Chitinophagaceae bacterium]